MIDFLIEHPRVSILDFLVEPLPTAILAYGLVWLVMRPKKGRPALRMTWWHFWGIVTTLFIGAVMRLTVVALQVFFDNVGPALLLLNQPGAGISTVILSLFGAHHYLSKRLSSLQGISREYEISVAKSIEPDIFGTKDSTNDLWLNDIRARLFSNPIKSEKMFSQNSYSGSQPPDASRSESVDTPYASPWKRLGAGILDLLISIPAGLFLGLVLAPLLAKNAMDQQSLESQLNGIGYIVWWVYYATMESSTLQATLGKMAFGLKVADTNGNRISFWNASGRHWGKLISAMPLLIGFVMIFFTKRKQGLHDIMAGCIVLDKRI